MIAPDGQHRAYGELKASRNPGPTESCTLTARLYVSKRPAAMRVLLTEPTFEDAGTGSSLAPIGWSRDSRWLAIERLDWTMDSGATTLLLYDSRSGKVSTPDVLGAVQRAMKKHCELGYRAVFGFDSQDRIRMRLADYEDDNGRETSCINGTADWLYDLSSGQAHRVSK